MPPQRALLRLLGLGLVIASCVGGDPTGANDEAGTARLELQPALIPSAADAGALPINRITAFVLADTVQLATRTIDVSPAADSWTLALTVPLVAGPQQARITVFLLNVASDGNQAVQFSGRSEIVEMVPGAEIGTVDVDVVRGPLANLDVTDVTITSAPATLAVGSVAELSATATSSTSVTPSIFWTSLAPDVLTMSDAVATGIAAGTAQVVATAGAFSDTVSIDVFVTPVASVRVMPDSADVWVAGTATYTADLRDAEDQPLLGRDVTWSIGDPEIATVSNTGVVSGVALGTTYVRATSEGVFDDAVVHVVPAPPSGGANHWIPPSGSWSDASRWSQGRVPIGTDTVYLTEGLDYQVSMDVDGVAGRLVIGGAGDVISLDVGAHTLTIEGTAGDPALEILALGSLSIGDGFLTAPDISNQGMVRSDGNAVITTSSIVNEGSWSAANGAQSLVGPVDFVGSGTIDVDVTGGMIFLGGANLDHTGGSIEGNGSISFPQAGTLTLHQDLMLDGPLLSFSGGTIASVGSRRLTLGSAGLAFLAGTTQVAPKVDIGAGGFVAASGSVTFADSLTIDPDAIVTLDGTGGDVQLDALAIDNSGQILLTGTGTATLGVLGPSHSLINRSSGLIELLGPGERYLVAELLNEGVLQIETSTVLWRRDGQSQHVTAHHVNDGEIFLFGDIDIHLGGTSPTFTNRGQIVLDDAALGVVNVAGAGGAIVNDDSGTLGGNGSVRLSGNPVGINNGVISPGLSPGTLGWEGSVPMGPNGSIVLEIQGNTPGTEHDQLNVTDTLRLDGTLFVDMPGFVPAGGDRFPVITYNGRTGTWFDLILPEIPGFDLDTVWAEAGTADTLYIVATATGPAPVNRWLSPVDGEWNDGSMWSLGTPPAPGDSVIIDVAGTYSVSLTDDATVAYLIMGAASGEQTFLHQALNTLTIDEAAEFGTSTRYVLGGSIAGAGDVTFAGQLDWLQGSMIGSGTTRVTGDPNLLDTADKTLDGRTFRNQTNMSWTGGTLSLASGAQFINETTATLTLDGANGMFGLGVGSFQNDGTITVAGATGAISLSGGSTTFVNDGLVQVLVGNVQLGGPGTITHTGDFTVGGGALLRFTGGTQTLAGSVTGNGGVVLGGDTTVDGVLSSPSITVTATGVVTLSPSSSISVMDTLRVTAGTAAWSTGSPVQAPTYVQTGGTLAGADSIEVTGAFQWTGGTMSGDRALRLAPSVTSAVFGSTATPKTLAAGARFRNAASIDWQAGPVAIGGGSLFVNEAGATIDIAGSGGPNQATGGGAFENFGTIVRSAGTAAITLGSANVVFVNHGLVDVQSRRVNIGGGSGVTHSGDFTVSAGDTIAFTASAPVVIDGDIANQGTILVGGTVALNGSLTTDPGSTLQVGGVAGTTDLTVANPFTNTGLLELTSASDASTTLTVAGTLTNAAGATLASLTGSGGDRTLAATLVDNSGTLGVEISLALNGALDQQSGALATVADGQTLAISGILTLFGGSTTTATGTLTHGGCSDQGGAFSGFVCD